MGYALIIETVPRAQNPIDAHSRNSIALKKGLAEHGWKVDLLFSDERSDVFQKKYDVILISYATPYPDVKGLEKIWEANKETPWGWITNEYNLRPNGFAYKIFKEAKSFLLCNYDPSAVKFACFDSAHSVNLNVMLYKEFPDKFERSYRFIYYGTYRPDREKYFKEYLQEGVHLSTSPKNHKRFKHIGCKATPMGKLSWGNPALLRFAYSLYIEDTFTHSNFNNLANRFYESLGAGCVLLFDRGCLDTLEKSGIKGYEPYVIDGYADMQRFKLEDYAEHAQRQRVWREGISGEISALYKRVSDILRVEACRVE